jgi:phosphopantothenoylcysteine synthetase/decarboxylase
MVRFDRFTAGRYWVDDYGYPSKEADFKMQMTYSPYHNIKSGVAYPAVIVSTADTDDRVVPGHSFKYISALQAADTGSKPKIIRIESAREMFEACTREFQHSDIAVLAAAVADYRPVNVSAEKIKKKDSPLELRLEETEDIAASLGMTKKTNQKLICFALETENEEVHALSKMQRKNADLLILNSLRTEGVYFGSENNAITLFHSNGSKKEISLKSKTEIAQIISNEIAELFQ